MKVWQVVLGAIFAIAVLSLAYAVANNRYQAVAHERDESVRHAQQLSVKIDELQVEHANLLQEKVDLESTVLGLQTLSLDLQEKLATKGKEILELKVEHANLLQEKADLEVTALGLQTLSLDLQGKLASKGKEYDALSSAVGTLEGVKSQVSGLEQQVQSLNGDIARLQAARAPLIVESYRGSFACTGSMEPKITCLDEATWLSNLRPEEVTVGTVISFTPIAECGLSTTHHVAHRVIAINVEAGATSYRTKGDANSSDDGCWIPSSSVNGYIIALYKNTKLENAPIRDRINALKAAKDYALAVYDAADQVSQQKKASYDSKSAAYETYVNLYCPGYVCPTQYYSTAQSLYLELEGLRLAVNTALAAKITALVQYNTAYNSYWAAIEEEIKRVEG